MVKLTLDQSPCDFKNTLFKFRNKFFFKKSALELATGPKKVEIIDSIVNTIFEVMPDQDVFIFRDHFVDIHKATSLDAQEALNIAAVMEYTVVYSLGILDMAGSNILGADPGQYVNDATGWFPYFVDNATYLDSALSSLRSPGIVSIDKRFKQPSKKVVEAVLTHHLTRKETDIRSGFAAMSDKDLLKIIWQ